MLLLPIHHGPVVTHPMRQMMHMMVLLHSLQDHYRTAGFEHTVCCECHF